MPILTSNYWQFLLFSLTTSGKYLYSLSSQIPVMVLATRAIIQTSKRKLKDLVILNHFKVSSNDTVLSLEIDFHYLCIREA